MPDFFTLFNRCNTFLISAFVMLSHSGLAVLILFIFINWLIVAFRQVQLQLLLTLVCCCCHFVSSSILISAVVFWPHWWVWVPFWLLGCYCLCHSFLLCCSSCYHGLPSCWPSFSSLLLHFCHGCCHASPMLYEWCLIVVAIMFDCHDLCGCHSHCIVAIMSRLLSLLLLPLSYCCGHLSWLIWLPCLTYFIVIIISLLLLLWWLPSWLSVDAVSLIDVAIIVCCYHCCWLL